MHGSKSSLPESLAPQRLPLLVGGDWRLLPYFILRQAGFPFEWLDEFVSMQVVQAADEFFNGNMQAVAAQRAAQQALKNLLRTQKLALPMKLQDSLLDILSRIGRGKPIGSSIIRFIEQSPLCREVVKPLLTWNESLQQLEHLQSLFTQIHSQEYQRAGHATIRHFRIDRQLQEVLFLSNEASFDLFDSWLQSYKNDADFNKLKRDDERKIDTLVMYLQRICAKNDTHAHFGPFSIGKIISEHQDIQWEKQGQFQRIAFFAHWAAEEIAQKLGNDPTLSLWLRPRRKPGAFLANGHLHVLEFDYDHVFDREGRPTLQLISSQLLTSDEMLLLQACDGARTIADLFLWWSQLKPDTSWQSFQDCLHALERHQAVITSIEIPVGLPHPLADLQEKLLPAGTTALEWINTIASFQGSLHEFALSKDLLERRQLFRALKTQFSQLTGAAPSRGSGKFYADRAILYEECCGNLQGLRIGKSLAQTIETELASLWNFFLLIPCYSLTAQRTLLNNWFLTRFGPESQVPLDTFLSAFLEEAPMLEEQYTAIDAQIDEIIHAIDSKILSPSLSKSTIITIERKNLQELIEIYHIPLPSVCNPDVMVISESVEAIKEGKFQLLVGECHAIREILSHTSVSPFLQDAFPEFAHNVTTLYQDLLEEDEIVGDPIRNHSNKTFVQASLPCFDIETHGSSPKPRSCVLALHDLHVRQTTKGLRLYSPLLQKFVRLMASPIGSTQIRRNPFSIFGFPRRYGGLAIEGRGSNHIPRIVIGRVVLQRELWRFPSRFLNEAISIGPRKLNNEDGSMFLQAKALQRRLNLPRRGFAKIPGEAKPIYVDFDAPLITRQFIRLARRTNGIIEFSEMLPGPGQLWLQNAEGHYTSEFRFAFFNTREKSVGY